MKATAPPWNLSWSGRTMVLVNFQCRGIVLILDDNVSAARAGYACSECELRVV